MEIEIPPRKQQHHHHHHQLSGEEAMLHKFLPSATADDSESEDPYSSEHFRMYEFKVRRCTRSRSHDWTECPFAHPGEKARRRDPRRHHYSGTVCPDFRHGGCARGDSCEFAHGVFECWLHPARYRTEACKDGRHCTRKVCFFAHSPRQLRILPPSAASSPPPLQKKAHNHHGAAFNKAGHHCCVCSHHRETSPTSHLSPPMSPMSSVSYKDALTDLMSSLEAMHFGEFSPSSGSPMSRRESKPWLDVSPFGWGENSPSSGSPMSRRENKSWVDVSPFGYSDEQPQFVLSPTTPSSSVSPGNYRPNIFSGKRYINGNYGAAFADDYQVKNDGNGGSNSDPDLGWVNELLM